MTIINRVNYYWRLFATGFSFFAFGLGGFLLRGIVFPIINFILTTNSNNKPRSAGNRRKKMASDVAP